MSYNLSQIQSLLRQTGWPESLIPKMAAIVMYESAGNPNAHNTNGEDSRGLLQIYTTVHPEYDRSRLYDPVYNLTVALDLYNRQGINAWYNSNRKYLNDYQGKASESLAVYNGSGGSVDNSVANYSPATTGTSLGQGGFIILLVGFGLLVFLRQRESY